MSGYVVGPVLAEGESPFPLFWEQAAKTNDGHVHVWENVLVRRRFLGFEECVRCIVCGCPRCGDSTDRDPCMERRHHRAPHRYLSGRAEKVGV